MAIDGYDDDDDRMIWLPTTEMAVSNPALKYRSPNIYKLKTMYCMSVPDMPFKNAETYMLLERAWTSGQSF
jgi:hypothetical protein